MDLTDRATPAADVRLRIDKVLLDGFPAADRDGIAAALAAELSRLLTERGLPPALTAGGEVPSLDGGAFDLDPGLDAEAIGRRVAGAVYDGMGV